MNEEMGGSNDQQFTEQSKSDQLTESKPYASPRLTKLGRVAELTQGEGSQLPDGMVGETGEATP